MSHEILNTFIERDSIDYSKRYRFNPDEDGRCNTSRKGQLVLHRRLVNAVLGINFPKTNLKVVEQIEKNGQLCGLIIQPVIEPQAERITIYRFKYGAILALDTLLSKLNLNYKRFQYSFISELITLDDRSFGIRLTLEETKSWPEYLDTNTESAILLPKNVVEHTDPYINYLISTWTLENELNYGQLKNKEEQIQSLFSKLLDVKDGLKAQTNNLDFYDNLSDFSLSLNYILFQNEYSENILGLIAFIAKMKEFFDKDKH
ncbi:hypothetical protein GO755_16395 [Spirosoma sp. HMF4905]|uniref:Uncharacterized protein n=1 Tax=Spirosoma arboris TaxID=2682092 RepID=A0A7K1SD75_9BACT|nr:hypothetical protein [Spirosoma arboris]MVM31628.1 hypothetical protein [Spirosoma arboris]